MQAGLKSRPVVFEDGTTQNFSTFERPHLVFDDEGVPTHTARAVYLPAPYCPMGVKVSCVCLVAAMPGRRSEPVIKLTKSINRAIV